MIYTERGNIWSYEPTHLIVIPTNIGWKKTGENVMGRGLALEAAQRYPELARWYGEQCLTYGADTPVVLYPNAPLILFPVKPLNVSQPHLSWKNRATLQLIDRSAAQLVKMPVRSVAVSLVGCGNGGLTMADVRPILDKHLSDGRFTLVLRP